MIWCVCGRCVGCLASEVSKGKYRWGVSGEGVRDDGVAKEMVKEKRERGKERI